MTRSWVIALFFKFQTRLYIILHVFNSEWESMLKCMHACRKQQSRAAVARWTRQTRISEGLRTGCHDWLCRFSAMDLKNIPTWVIPLNHPAYLAGVLSVQSLAIASTRTAQWYWRLQKSGSLWGEWRTERGKMNCDRWWAYWKQSPYHNERFRYISRDGLSRRPMGKVK